MIVLTRKWNAVIDAGKINWGYGGTYAPPLSNFQTGMPSFRALSARFS
jgi:hypothetical protein